jgi:hypothetical protein
MPLFAGYKHECRKYDKCEECGAPRRYICRELSNKSAQTICTGRQLLNSKQCVLCAATIDGIKKKYCSNCKRLKQNKKSSDYYQKRKKEKCQLK